MKALGVGLIACVLALAGCGPSLGRLDEMARSGEIDSGAPVVAHVEMEIAAPPAKVWALLIDAGRWPMWDQDIARVSVTGPLALGTRFTWGEGSNTVHSEVQLFEPGRRLAWTRTAFTAKAIHAWVLRPSAGGGTVVTVDESMDGPLMAQMFSSEKLAASDRDWLGYLKKAAER
jgi:uncharacterized protein YndB with AHSA1/START domain